MWLPVPPSVNTDIPLQEVDARYLERLSQIAVRIINMQSFTTESLYQWLEREYKDLSDDETSVPKSALLLLDHTIQDMLRVSIELLVSFMNLRRDVVLSHSRIPPDWALLLQNRPFLSDTYLFSSDDLDAVHKYVYDSVVKMSFVPPPVKLKVE